MYIQGQNLTRCFPICIHMYVYINISIYVYIHICIWACIFGKIISGSDPIGGDVHTYIHMYIITCTHTYHRQGGSNRTICKCGTAQHSPHSCIYIYICINYNTHTHTSARGAITAQISHAVQHSIHLIHAYIYIYI